MLRTKLLQRFALLLALAACSLSCSVLIDTKKQQCVTDQDCANLGEKFTDSICLNSVCTASPDAGPTGPLEPLGCVEPAMSDQPRVALTFNVAFTAPPMDLQPFAIKACGPIDYNCDSPLASVMVDNGENATLQVPTGFQGFLQITNPGGVDSLVFLGRPIVQDTHGYDLTIATQATVQGLGFATKTTIDPNLGIFVVTTRDCDRQPLSGVVVTTDQEGPTGFYFQNMSPLKSLPATTSEGAAGFVNVPTVVVSVSAVYNGRKMTSNSALSRPGGITYVEIFP